MFRSLGVLGGARAAWSDGRVARNAGESRLVTGDGGSLARSAGAWAWPRSVPRSGLDGPRGVLLRAWGLGGARETRRRAEMPCRGDHYEDSVSILQFSSLALHVCFPVFAVLFGLLSIGQLEFRAKSVQSPSSTNAVSHLERS